MESPHTGRDRAEGGVGPAGCVVGRLRSEVLIASLTEGRIISPLGRAVVEKKIRCHSSKKMKPNLASCFGSYNSDSVENRSSHFRVLRGVIWVNG